MNKIFIFVVLCVLSLCSYAQSHMTFKGMELNCTSKDLKNSLVSQGYRFMGEVYDMYLLEGTFAGEHAEIFVVGFNDSKLVQDIEVKFDEEATWESLKSKYFLFKSSLSDKYGEGVSTETFLDSYCDGCGDELGAISANKCQYSTVFPADNGSVTVSIDKAKKVKIVYKVDLNNSKEQQRKSDL